jgi:hypothetical protein
MSPNSRRLVYHPLSLSYSKKLYIKEVQRAEDSLSHPDSIRSVDPDSESGSGSRRAKKSTKIGRSSEISCFEVLDVPLLRAEGFSCSLDVLYGGLGISRKN